MLNSFSVSEDFTECVKVETITKIKKKKDDCINFRNYRVWHQGLPNTKTNNKDLVNVNYNVIV